jgi:glutamine synthetase
LQGVETEKAVRQIVKDYLSKHRRIVFGGNGYSAEWRSEAESRGLKNYISTADVLGAIKTEANYATFESLKIMTRKEFEAFVEVDLTSYVQVQQLESEAMVVLANRYLIPAAIAYQNEVLKNADSVPSALRVSLKELIESAYKATAELKESSKTLTSIANLQAAAEFGAGDVKQRMRDLRVVLDNIEEIVDQKFWPIPTYEQILLTRHKRTEGSLHLCNGE